MKKISSLKALDPYYALNDDLTTAINKQWFRTAARLKKEIKQISLGETLGSSPKLRARIEAGLKPTRIGANCSAKKLACDLTVGHKRVLKVGRRRLQKVLTRVKRVKSLAKGAGRKAATRIFRAGPTPASTYGATVLGMSDTHT